MGNQHWLIMMQKTFLPGLTLIYAALLIIFFSVSAAAQIPGLGGAEEPVSLKRSLGSINTLFPKIKKYQAAKNLVFVQLSARKPANPTHLDPRFINFTSNLLVFR
jgi:hypothetical protein